MNWNEAINRIQRDPKLLQMLSESPDGQELMARLQKNGQSLEQAAESGQKGDLVAMTRLLRDVMSDKEGLALLERLSQRLK